MYYCYMTAQINIAEGSQKNYHHHNNALLIDLLKIVLYSKNKTRLRVV